MEILFFTWEEVKLKNCVMHFYTDNNKVAFGSILSNVFNSLYADENMCMQKFLRSNVFLSLHLNTCSWN